MAFTDRLKLIIDADVKGFTSGLSEIKSKIGEADGFFGKLKAGAGGIGDAFKSLGPGAQAGLAASGIAAVGTAAFAAVSKFASVGVEVGNFATATGMSTEQASRWVEVAGDMGVDAGVVEKAIGKLNKTIDPAVFKQFGIEIAHAKDGTVDANATFLNAIDRLHGMTDAEEQAKAGAKLFGKGWQSMAEFVGAGADDLRNRLQGVADVKILHPGDVKDAREFRDAMANLKDAGEELVLTFGKALLPAITGLAAAAGDAVKSLGPLITALGEVIGLATKWGLFKFDPTGSVAIEATAKSAQALRQQWIDGKISAEQYNQALNDMPLADAKGRVLDLSAAAGAMSLAAGDSAVEFDAVSGAVGAFNVEAGAAGVTADALALAQGKASKAAADLAESTDRAKRSAEQLTAQWDALKGSISADQAFLTIQDQFDQVKASAKDAWDAASSGAVDAAAKARANKSDVDSLKLSVIDFGKEVLGLPPDRVVKINGEIDNGSLDLAANQLAIWARNHTMNVSIQAHNAPGYGPQPRPGQNTTVPIASGGVVMAPTVALVGEGGEPEAVIPLSKLPGLLGVGPGAGGRAGGGGDTFIIHTRETSDRELANMRQRAARHGHRV